MAFSLMRLILINRFSFNIENQINKLLIEKKTFQISIINAHGIKKVSQ